MHFICYANESFNHHCMTAPHHSDLPLLIKTKLVEWTGYETSQTTKKITMLPCFMLCVGSRL